MRLRPVVLSLVVLASPLAAAEPSAAIARGDAAWERRGDGQRDGVAQPGPIGEAVAAYEAARRERPQDLEACWKLQRALWFQGDYVARDAAEKRRVFERGREVGEAAKDILARAVGGREKLDDMAPAAQAKALRGVAEAPAIYLWSAVDWGLWADAFGRLAAARQGVATRVRDDALVVIALDPRFETGGGHRVLGRLHAEAPSIPFVTGWIDRATAIRELERAVELGPGEPIGRLFLAEALLDHRPAERPRALALLRDLAALTPRPAFVTEDTRVARQARELLAATR
jgi:hypothetical protein